MSSPTLSDNGDDQQQSNYLGEFKTGKLTLKGSTDAPTRGEDLVFLHQSDNNLMHFCGKDNRTSVSEDDFVLFPDNDEESPQSPMTDKNYIMNKYLEGIKPVSDKVTTFGDKSPINFEICTPKFELDNSNNGVRRNDHPTKREIAQMVIKEIIKFS